MNALPRLTAPQADALAERFLDHCRTAGVLDPEAPAVPWADYHAFRARLISSFQVPTTTLTPLAARVLYGLAAAHQPATVATLGCFAGNLMAWVSGPGFGPRPLYPGRRSLGLDVDAAPVALASDNLRRAGFAPGAEAVVGDAFEAAGHSAGGPWDLLLIDIDVPGSRKSGYARLLERWLPHLAPGALVVAHDVCHPVFAWDLRDYPAFATEHGAVATTTLPVDACGLEVSRWPG
ncbi:class I SAM-dependent methyltransferase [Streptomyces phaeoluteigriseus]|uniref:Class I SAM-dependent methyltransferase n=1 Tax=Streptomyces phaeoluteigriseus TaxID=114686 RepID=A0ABY4Z6K3_9ACTN|nr:class I SAM-dependent methyltransferase [Streptomyces phaeoluteigriseus]USQ84482.1 class I SAM-dependent methyltransferase [Streptomyces phaeoluteigriseus]